LPLARVHAHIERAVASETEAARGVVELRRGHTQVEQHPIHTLQAEAFEYPGQFGEARVHHAKASVAYSCCSRDRLRILVERDQAPVRTQPVEDQAAVSAASKGCINVATISAYCQSIDRLLQQHRLVSILSRNGGHRAKSSIPGGSWVCAVSCCNCFSQVS